MFAVSKAGWILIEEALYLAVSVFDKLAFRTVKAVYFAGPGALLEGPGMLDPKVPILWSSTIFPETSLHQLQMAADV